MTIFAPVFDNESDKMRGYTNVWECSKCKCYVYLYCSTKVFDYCYCPYCGEQVASLSDLEMGAM